ncbi:MAG: Ldh family oxidoreductase [Thermomicrobiales bacterium]
MTWLSRCPARAWSAGASARSLPVPTNWAFDGRGNETTDPASAMDGPLVPMGMFKGTGLSIFTDILCGVLTGAAFGGALYSQADNHDVGHMLIAIDIGGSSPMTTSSAVWIPATELKASDLADGFNEILLPGEIEHRRAVERLSNGIDLDSEVYETLRDLATARDVPFNI